MSSDIAARPAPSLPTRWRHVLRTGSPKRGATLDPVSKWLVLTRASVLPMTLTAGAVAGLLAVRQEGFRPGWFLLSLVGIVLAHMANNLMNDLFDLEVGSDSATYPRALYAPHPILSGLTTKRGLATSAIVCNLLDVAILALLFVRWGWPVVAFAVAGFVLSAAYTAPPLRLKKRGLGEPTVLIVWGPLMVGGCYYAGTGSIPWQVVAASIPYGLLCTAVLMGKHTDKIDWDAPQDIKTLPVLLGESLGRAVTRGLMVGFYVTVMACVALQALPWPSLVVFAAVPALQKVWGAFGRPRPTEAPPNFPVWPLWFAPLAFLHTRRAGALLVLGLAAAAAIDQVPSF